MSDEELPIQYQNGLPLRLDVDIIRHGLAFNINTSIAIGALSCVIKPEFGMSEPTEWLAWMAQFPNVLEMPKIENSKIITVRYIYLCLPINL